MGATAGCTGASAACGFSSSLRRSAGFSSTTGAGAGGGLFASTFFCLVRVPLTTVCAAPSHRRTLSLEGDFLTTDDSVFLATGGDL